MFTRKIIKSGQKKEKVADKANNEVQIDRRNDKQFRCLWNTKIVIITSRQHINHTF